MALYDRFRSCKPLLLRHKRPEDVVLLAVPMFVPLLFSKRESGPGSSGLAYRISGVWGLAGHRLLSVHFSMCASVACYMCFWTLTLGSIRRGLQSRNERLVALRGPSTTKLSRLQTTAEQFRL